MCACAALEEEKAHMDVLIVRQLNLISCFTSSDTLSSSVIGSSNGGSSKVGQGVLE
jgi:hypothetical protein